MSKLYDKFKELKEENKNKLYLLKSGIFYIALNEDAEKISKLFNFKITNLNSTVIKCGFPEKQLEKYTNILSNCSVDFEIIDSTQSKITNVSNYLENEKIKNNLKNIQKLDMNKISFQDAFFILQDLNSLLKNFSKNL